MNSRPSYHFVPDLQELAGSGPATDQTPFNIQGRAVYADGRIKVLLLPFRAGQTLAEHTTPHDAIMHVLSGQGRITLANDVKEVRAGAWMWMQGRLPHSIHADTDLLLLLQVALEPGDVPSSPRASA